MKVVGSLLEDADVELVVGLLLVPVSLFCVDLFGNAFLELYFNKIAFL